MTLQEFIQDCVNKTTNIGMSSFVLDLLIDRVEKATNDKKIAKMAADNYCKLIAEKFPQP